jgi:hypothetical protein
MYSTKLNSFSNFWPNKECWSNNNALLALLFSKYAQYASNIEEGNSQKNVFGDLCFIIQLNCWILQELFKKC